MKLFGNKDEERSKEIDSFLFDGEVIENTYGLLMDFACLTNKRVMFVDKTLLSKKKAIISIPYNRIDSIAIELGGALSISNEIEIITRGKEYELKFIKGADVQGFYRKLAQYICK